ncbi:MAG TPA: EAL domain-containing protein [Acidimicrobiales bacterium]|nr:EAL domain-containing protein [Acidimicrobiales bacterium]
MADYGGGIGSMVGGEETFDADMDHAIERGGESLRAEIESFLTEHRLTVVFQPVVDLGSMQRIGYEAFARVPGASQPPSVWFREARTEGLLEELELEAMRIALSEADRFPDDVFIALNASPSTAASTGIRDVIASFPFRRIVLDINEAAAIDDYPGLESAIDKLRGEGVRIALDDAGSGSTSLRHIAGVGPDFIKIDTSITRGIDTDLSNQAVAMALHSFGTRMGAVTIAEGIETEGELQMLASMGVQVGQGYFLGHPEPVEKVLA